jgi:hypothetical protein
MTPAPARMTAIRRAFPGTARRRAAVFSGPGPAAVPDERNAPDGFPSGAAAEKEIDYSMTILETEQQLVKSAMEEAPNTPT